MFGGEGELHKSCFFRPLTQKTASISNAFETCRQPWDLAEGGSGGGGGPKKTCDNWFHRRYQTKT